MENHGHRVICVPAEADAPKIRLLECAHLERIGNRGVDGTIFRFVPLFVLDRAKTLPQFQVGQYFLVARVSGKGKRRKLSSIWTGPWRVPTNDQKLVYVEKHLVIAELSEVLVVWMRVYADDHLEITGELRMIFQQLITRGSTTSGASWLSIGLQAATSSLARYRENYWTRWKALRSRCHAWSMTRRPWIAKTLTRCG